MKDSLSIACTLSDDALKKRQSDTLGDLFAEARTIEPLPSGYRFEFNVSDALLERLYVFIREERKCCRFMNFTLEVSAGEGPVHLGITGPEGTKAFLESLLEI